MTFWLWMVGLLVGAAYLAWLSFRPLVRLWVRRRLGGYRHRFNDVEPSKPWSASEPKSIAVVGSGLAGLAAANVLSERGMKVTVLEAEDYVGGKVGAWTQTLSTGETVPVSHGFHAFFRHYYNLNRFLDRLGIRQTFRPVEDYVILSPDGSSMGFKDLDSTPVLNLLSLRKAGVYRMSDVLLSKARDYMHIFFRYDPDHTFAAYDHEPFDRFAERIHLPASLKKVFNTFARAFFADESKISTAELMKSIHYYYFGHDLGLVYDMPTRDFGASILDPVVQRLKANGVQVTLGHKVERLMRHGAGWHVDGQPYDAVVVAADVAGVKRLTETLGNEVGLDPSVLEPGQRYASLRLWIDRDARKETPAFVITDRKVLLDAVAFYHRIEDEARDYVDRHGGAVVELHCYAVPDDVGSDAEVRRMLLDELVVYFPELEGFRIRDESFYVAKNFTAFHVGRHASRPPTRGRWPGLVFAGDWVKLPFPAMLMEAAFSSGILAANVLLEAEGLRQEPIDMVPPRGFLPPWPEADRAAPVSAGNQVPVG